MRASAMLRASRSRTDRGGARPASRSGWPPRPAVAAHGAVPSEPPSVAAILFGWTFEPLPTLAILIAPGWWLWAVGG